MTDIAFHLLLVGGFALVLSLALAPIESLGWWAGWLGPEAEPEPSPAPADDGSPPGCFVVFLSGIGSISGDELLPAEGAFLDRLQAAHPEARIVRDVFPYAPSGRPLVTGQRVFAWLWRRVLAWRLNGTRWLPAILNMRNLFQVLVSADHRYGPLYSFAISRIARERLEAHGYRRGSGVPVILLGSSGGGQISVGAVPYLLAEIEASLSVVTFGGVMASDRGVAEAARLASLYGAGDRVYALGRTVFPGRWPVATSSFWNVARSEHRLAERVIGSMHHSGSGGYLDPVPRSEGAFLDITVREVAAAVRQVVSPDEVEGPSAERVQASQGTDER
jgi:hypothetical protein